MGEYIEKLNRGGFCLIQRDDEFKLGLDAVLLAHFAPLSKNARVADLGCGAGAIPVLLASYREDISIDGIEINPSACELARRNVELNGLHERVKIIEGDIRFIGKYMKAGEYSLVVSNPPYIKTAAGRRPREKRAVQARTEETCTLDELCFAAKRVLRFGGTFAVVYRTDRLPDLLCAMRAYGIEPKRLRLVHDRPGIAPSLALVLGKRGGLSGSFEIDPPFFIRDSEGAFTKEMLEIDPGPAKEDF